MVQYVQETVTHFPTREVDGDSHTLFFKIGDQWRRWPAPLKKAKWMRVATPSTLKMGHKCEGGGHPVSKKSIVHYGIG